jgi:hypothetical protein
MAAANNLIWFGTPIALNLYGALRGSPVEAIDARLRERTGGLCTLQPSKVPVPPTIRWRNCRCGQESRARMSSAPMVVPNALPSSSTLANSLAFLAFSAMTLSSMVSLATSR